MATQQKLDSRTRYLLHSLGQPDAPDADASVAVLVRGRESFRPEQLEALRAAGASVRTVAGDVLTADAPVSAIQKLADQEFVVEVALSQPLYPEEGTASGRAFLDVE